jgi:hypothetical protein
MSKLDEILATRRPSIVTSVRCDARSLASLALFARKENEPIRSRGELLRLAVEWFAAIVVKQNPELEVKTATKALKVLQMLNMDPTRKQRALLDQLAEEEIRGGGIEPEAFLPGEQSFNEELAKTVSSAMEGLVEAEERRRLEDENLKRTMADPSGLPIGEEE